MIIAVIPYYPLSHHISHQSYLTVLSLETFSWERMRGVVVLVVFLLNLGLSSSEDAARFTGLKVPDDLDRSNSPAMDKYLFSLRTESVPDAFDAVKEGWIGKPKYQLSCGSCVVFTNVGLIETCIGKEALKSFRAL